MTAKEIARDAQRRIDEVIEAMVAEYGVDKVNMATVVEAMRTEVLKATYEEKEYGRVLTNKERWGK